MSSTTRTIGPLHFEDLEPHRFEDLARQLVYDFRPWRALEATGRSGSDEGFDARGFEVVNGGDSIPVVEADDPADETTDATGNDRVWLIQCKREQTITPAKLRKHLADIAPKSLTDLYGVILIVACDFSKKARDEFIRWRLENGISEGYIWGKAELEDQLYQPKNDGLLFAYFGFSLRIRRRSIKTELRAKLAMKRKSARVLTEFTSVLVRDPDDDRYPFRLSAAEEAANPRRWKVRKYLGQDYLGLKFELYTHYAYLADDEESWDVVEAFKNDLLNEFDDPWHAETDESPTSSLHSLVWNYWHKLPDRNQANLVAYIVVPYEHILDIDEKTDGVFNGATVYCDTATKFLRREVVENLDRFQRIKAPADPARRIRHFPDAYPDQEPARNQFFE